MRKNSIHCLILPSRALVIDVCRNYSNLTTGTGSAKRQNLVKISITLQ